MWIIRTRHTLYIYICVSGVMVAMVRLSLPLSLWLLPYLLEHYPLMICGIFACVVVVAVHREDVLGGGVVVIPLEYEVYLCRVGPHYNGWAVVPFCDYSLALPINVPLTHMECTVQFFFFRVKGFETVFVGWVRDILNFGGRVSLEGSSSSNSRAESSSEDHEGIITSLQWPQLHS